MAKVRRSAGSARCASQAVQKRRGRAPSARARCGAARTPTSAAPAEVQQREEQEALLGADEARDEGRGQAPDQVAGDHAGDISGERIGGAHFAALGEMGQRQRESRRP